MSPCESQNINTTEPHLLSVEKKKKGQLCKPNVNTVTKVELSKTIVMINFLHASRITIAAI